MTDEYLYKVAEEDEDNMDDDDSFEDDDSTDWDDE